ncbi:unnamed protein product [Diatraea saccharalis]|uniref:Protein slit n=1 Tax=Diatraea saccharalis TaxID=40085 RepID=A0A9N9R560_9NEOP|nr:unnamed protein product [Diatraea saccharalis]
MSVADPQDDIMMERAGHAGDYLCKCAPGYSGRFCEYLTSLTFNHNDSWVELEPLRTQPQANVTLVFSTTQHHGVLMYFGDNEHLAVELFNGRVRVSYDVGNHPTSTMYSFEMVSDGNYHKAELLAIKKNFTLRVDDGPARSIINEGSKEYLRLESPMYLGGVPEDVAKTAFGRWHLRNVTSFRGVVTGRAIRLQSRATEIALLAGYQIKSGWIDGFMRIRCLKEAWINHKRVDFGNAVRMQRQTAGCGEEDAPPAAAAAAPQGDAKHTQDPCVPNPCARGGRCVREEGSPSDYTCRCRPGTAGAQCELRTSVGTYTCTRTQLHHGLALLLRARGGLPLRLHVPLPARHRRRAVRAAHLRGYVHMHTHTVTPRSGIAAACARRAPPPTTRAAAGPAPPARSASCAPPWVRTHAHAHSYTTVWHCCCVREEGSPSDYTCRCRPGTAGAQCELRTSVGGAPVISQSKLPPRKPFLISNVQASPAAPAHKQQQQQPSAPVTACRKKTQQATHISQQLRHSRSKLITKPPNNAPAHL